MLSLFRSIKRNRTNNRLKEEFSNITKEMSKKEMAYINNGKDFVIIPLHMIFPDDLSINDLCLNLSEQIRKLWKEKGFNSSFLETRSEKVVLMISEISELADAEKKGKSEKEIIFELADIVIRAANLLSCDETLPCYKNMCKIMPNHDISLPLLVSKDISSEKKLKLKYDMIEKMHEVCGDIIFSSKRLEFSIEERPEDKAREFIIMWNHIMILVGYCIVYVDSFYENQNLQEAIQEKMAINFNRPYKYNTFEEMQK